jgi:H+-translocating diphosphatase
MKFYTTVLLIVAMIGVASALDSVASPDVHLLNTNTSDVLGNKNDASILIFTTSFVGILFALYLNYIVSSIPLQLTATGGQGSDQSNYSLLAGQSVNGSSSAEELESKSMELRDIYNTIRIGAKAFLWAEYKICFLFIFTFGLVILFLVSHVGGENPWDWQAGGLTALSFVVGGLTSIISGYIGMMVAVNSNARCTIQANKVGSEGWRESFNAAFRAGGVMGFSLCGLSLVILYILALIYRSIFTAKGVVDYTSLFECLAGYGLGGSSIAMFGRVGGGIFTKAADVGADLAGKVIGVDGVKLDEDSPYNPAVIADNVGDNVGDVAGMGSDLFGSFGEASCAALLVGASSDSIREAGWNSLMFPLFISAAGIVVCLLVSFVATHLWVVKREEDVETVLKVQLLLTSAGMSAALYPLTKIFLPSDMSDLLPFHTNVVTVTPWTCYLCVIAGLWGGCAIGFITEYYTSHSYTPVRDVARSTETGAATNIIYGLALGYKSAIVPVIIISAIIYLGLKTAGMYGVALGALGMLSTLATCLSIDVYGPVCDNAGGIAEMCELDEHVREKTDALDSAGNTTAAIGKGFAIGSAALVSLALFGAFVTRVSTIMNVGSTSKNDMVLPINLLRPVVFAFLVLGAMVPYWFSAMTMRSVGEAANAMVKEVARQFSTIDGLGRAATMTVEERIKVKRQGGTVTKPDYQRCIEIATNASLSEMVAPGMLVIVSPILCGLLFGVEAVSGLLAGALASSVQLAISMSNTGGAWDNAKKYCEKGELNGWLPYHGGGVTSEKFFELAARENGTGNICMTQKDAAGNNIGIKEFLEQMSQTDPEKYRRVMEGEEPVECLDRRLCVYAGKKSAAHSACVVGDTVGDPLKDTSGPALNIVMKLMAIISVVFANFFMSVNCGNGALNTGEVTWAVGDCRK